MAEAAPAPFVNQLHYGDNLERLRGHVPDATADLIYLDPPFNSARNYNLLFKRPGSGKGKPSEEESPAQITAFEDTWQWSARAWQEVVSDPRNGRVLPLLSALRQILGESEMMAYITMMAPRLVELHRVLKPTGSLYLHCDPVASHYLKLLLDVVFGPTNFRSEIIWKRTFAHGNVTKNYGDVTDTLLFYTYGSKYYWNQPWRQLDAKERARRYPKVDRDGRRWQSVSLRNPGFRPNLHYPFTASNGLTYNPHPNGWVCNRARLEQYDRELRLHFPATPDGALRLKMYEDESLGDRVQSLWTDIPPIGAQAAERRGYPTQKPLALLERIIAASCPEGGVVLDPFCGCGTAVVAAERMGRKWIGIDVTYLAINQIVDRLNTEGREGEPAQYVLMGTPTDEDAVLALFNDPTDTNHKKFEQWAVTLVQGNYNPKMGADGGVDGVRHLWDHQENIRDVLIQVKGGQSLTVDHVKALCQTVKIRGAVAGILVSQKEATSAMRAIAEAEGEVEWYGFSFPKIQLLTTRGILERGEAPLLPKAFAAKAHAGVGTLKRSVAQEELF